MRHKIGFVVMLLLLTTAFGARAQLLYNNGALVFVNTNAIVQVNGDVSNNATGTLNNLGDVTITSTFTNNANAGGDGAFHVAGDWVNNSNFTAGSGYVELNGTNQMIAGTASTSFYDIDLTGSGVKSLGIDCYSIGILGLTDRELATSGFAMYVLNSDPAAITRTSGFVSSTGNGVLSRVTDATSSFLFPTGSSTGTPRYRPVVITPASPASNTFTVRMANVDAATEGFNRILTDSTICVANPDFYHRINRSGGSDAAKIEIYYDAVADGNWQGIGNWKTAVAQWQNTSTPTLTAGTPLSSISISGWNDFTNKPYILTTRKANAYITPVNPICANNSGFALAAAEPGGTWTGTGITNSGTGAFDPALAGPGTHQIIYTIAGTCGDVDTLNVTVYDVQALDAQVSDESCIGQSDGSITININGGSGPYTISWDNGSTSETNSPVAPGTYIVEVTDQNGCAISSTFDVKAATTDCATANVYVPNIFSPNGDNQNDELLVYGGAIKTLSFIIYDRWGEKIFETNDMSKGWDGTFRGQPMDPNVFVYYIEVDFTDGKHLTKKGNVTLVR
ncbi:MAG: gliding motility-associated C-terminal domain-containing protein [Bacteroidota bacterium]